LLNVIHDITIIIDINFFIFNAIKSIDLLLFNDKSFVLCKKNDNLSSGILWWHVAIFSKMKLTIL